MDVLSNTLSLDLINVTLSNNEIKELLGINDKDFVKEYLLSKGAINIEDSIMTEEIKQEKETKEDKVMIKICHLGKKGEVYRKEAMDLIKDVVVDDPTKPGFKMGYRKAANLLNKNGYRTFREKKMDPQEFV